MLSNTRHVATGEMMDEAASRGANAAVGVDLDYEVLKDRGSMLMVLANGTAVVVDEQKERLFLSTGDRVVSRRNAYPSCVANDPLNCWERDR